VNPQPPECAPADTGIKRRKRILFITHAWESCYGAATSLRLLLSHYDDIEADVIIPRSLRRRRDLSQSTEGFACVRHVYEMSLPKDLDCIGIPTPLNYRVHMWIHQLLWLFDRRKLKQLQRENRYDIVHLNSPILHQAALHELPIITHVRDIVLPGKRKVLKKLASRLGLVFIDAATKRPFEPILTDPAQNVVLNNPVDMVGVEGELGALNYPGLDAAKTVFTVLGRIEEIKGVHFIVEAFRQGANASAHLLIVGDGTKEYVARCRAAAGGDQRILFLGERGDVRAIYAITDYVVRGDPNGCIGRTVYEGLYAGCRVIMPGAGEPDFLFEPGRYREAINLYSSRDRKSLARAFAEGSGQKVGLRMGRSNVDEYVHAFDGFIEQRLRATPEAGLG
jgi:glycosyltransferase involved in cell wall biosynthesis